MTARSDSMTLTQSKIYPEIASLSRAVVYRFLSYAYRYPQSDLLSCLRRFSPAVENSLSGLTGAGYRDLSADFGRVVETLQTAILERVEEDWILLFGHSAQGTCPPYEGEYTESEEGLQQPHELGDLAAFYRAFGLEVGSETHERPDFIGVELAYLSFLCQKEAFAEENGDTELANLTIKAQATFLLEHLGRWAPAFARRILDRAERGVFYPLADFTLSFLSVDCKRLGVEPGSTWLRVRKASEAPEDYMECPMATAGNKLESRPE